MLKKVLFGALTVATLASSAIAADRGSSLDNSPFTGRQGDTHYADLDSMFCEIGDRIVIADVGRDNKLTNSRVLEVGRSVVPGEVIKQADCKRFVTHAFEDYFDELLKQHKVNLAAIAGNPIGGAVVAVEAARDYQDIVEDLVDAYDNLNSDKHIPAENWSSYDQNKAKGSIQNYIDHINTWTNWWDGRVDN